MPLELEGSPGVSPPASVHPSSLPEGETPVLTSPDADESTAALRESGQSENAEKAAGVVDGEHTPSTDRHSATSPADAAQNDKPASNDAAVAASVCSSEAPVEADDGREKAKEDGDSEERQNLPPVGGVALSESVNADASERQHESPEMGQYRQRSLSVESRTSIGLNTEEKAGERTEGASSTSPDGSRSPGPLSSSVVSNPVKSRISLSSLPTHASPSSSSLEKKSASNGSEETTHGEPRSPPSKDAGELVPDVEMSPRVAESRTPTSSSVSSASPRSWRSSLSEATPRRALGKEATPRGGVKGASKSSAASPRAVKASKVEKGGKEESKSSSAASVPHQKASPKAGESSSLESSSPRQRKVRAAKSSGASTSRDLGSSGKSRAGAASPKSAGSKASLAGKTAAKAKTSETGKEKKSGRAEVRKQGFLDSGAESGGNAEGRQALESEHAANTAASALDGGEGLSQKAVPAQGSSAERKKATALSKWLTISGSALPTSYLNKNAVDLDDAKLFCSSMSSSSMDSTGSSSDTDGGRSHSSLRRCFFGMPDRADTFPSACDPNPCTSMEAAERAWHQDKISSRSGSRGFLSHQSSCHSAPGPHAALRSWSSKFSAASDPLHKTPDSPRMGDSRVRSVDMKLRSLRTVPAKAPPSSSPFEPMSPSTPASGVVHQGKAGGDLASQFRNLNEFLAGTRGGTPAVSSNEDAVVERLRDECGDESAQQTPSRCRSLTSETSVGASATPCRSQSGSVTPVNSAWTPFTQLLMLKVLRQQHRMRDKTPQRMVRQETNVEGGVLRKGTVTSFATPQSGRSQASLHSLPTLLESDGRGRGEEDVAKVSESVHSLESLTLQATPGSHPSRASSSQLQATQASEAEPGRSEPSVRHAVLPPTPLERAFMLPFEQAGKGPVPTPPASAPIAQLPTQTLGACSPQMGSVLKLQASECPFRAVGTGLAKQRTTHAYLEQRLRSECGPQPPSQSNALARSRFSGVSPFVEVVMGEIEKEYEMHMSGALAALRSRNGGSSTVADERLGAGALFGGDTYGVFGETRLVEMKTRRTTDLDDLHRVDVSQRFLLACLLFLRSNNNSVKIWQEVDKCRRELRELLERRRQRTGKSRGRRQGSADGELGPPGGASLPARQGVEAQRDGGAEKDGAGPGSGREADEENERRNESPSAESKDTDCEKHGDLEKKEEQNGGEGAEKSKGEGASDREGGDAGGVEPEAVEREERSKEEEGAEGGVKGDSQGGDPTSDLDQNEGKQGKTEGEKLDPLVAASNANVSTQKSDGSDHDGSNATDDAYADSIDDLSGADDGDDSDAFKLRRRRARPATLMSHGPIFLRDKASDNEHDGRDRDLETAAAEAILQRLRALSERSKADPTLRTEQICGQCWTEGSLLPLLPVLLNSCRSAVPPTVAVPVVASAYVLIISSLFVARLQCCQVVADCCLLVRHFLDPSALTDNRSLMAALRNLKYDRARLECLQSKQAMRIIQDSRRSFVSILAAVYPFEFIASPEMLLRLQHAKLLLAGEGQKKKAEEKSSDAKEEGASKDTLDMPMSYITRLNSFRSSKNPRSQAARKSTVHSVAGADGLGPETNKERWGDEEVGELQVQVDRLNRRIDLLLERQWDLREAADELLSELVDLDHIEQEVMEEAEDAKAKKTVEKRQEDFGDLGMGPTDSARKDKEKDPYNESLAQIDVHRNEAEEQLIQLNEGLKRIGKELSRVQHQREELLAVAKKRQEEHMKKVEARRKAHEQLTRLDEIANKNEKGRAPVSSPTPASDPQTPGILARGSFSGSSSASNAPAHRGGVSWRAEGELRCLVEMTQLILKTIQMQAAGEGTADDSPAGRPRLLDEAEIVYWMDHNSRVLTVKPVHGDAGLDEAMRRREFLSLWFLKGAEWYRGITGLYSKGKT
ncbi:putative ppg3 [Neospora caninum Liverpool]|uniref:Putative ppg3 n=1 Tax=Neospora caninum (strain Liverpool) TaxID=572307 RepID=F0V8J9_NEOCL|nr:putative ppg3 [Neospora caninum Liverpool]CBZ50040.1 putative ppg3 [Neospora caninum Liverpool]|eukprot:XP_003880075.1 putative ppg3 [Neospora caninum Liverpool]